MNKLSKVSIKVILLILFTSTKLFSQIGSGSGSTNTSGQKLTVNTITTAVPFLEIAPDARAGGMGDAGVSSSPDVNSNHWNPAKYAFIDKSVGFGISYSPWLRALVPDINLAYLSGYKKLNKNQTLSASLLYFSLGDITFTDQNGNTTGQYKPNEFAIDLAYSRKFSENLSGGVALRYIYSNLTSGQYIGSQSSHAGQSVAGDISVYYHKNINVSNQKALFAFGLNISNIGTKISYTQSVHTDFIPTNLRLGPSITFNLDQYNTLSVMCDINKLLVPTPNSSDSVPISVVNGMFQALYKAPGGFKEKISELTYSPALEYWYDKQFAIRAGYFYESANKGGRMYFTLGAGIKYSVFGLDFAYLIPASTTVKSPLANTLRFSLIFDFEAFKDQNKDKK